MLSLAVWISTSIISVVRVSSLMISQMICRILERNESVVHSHSFNVLQSLTKVFETLPTLPASCPLQCCLTQSKWDSMLIWGGEVSPILRTVFQHFFTDCGFSIFGCLRACLHCASEFLACDKLTTGQLHGLFRVNQTKNSRSLTTFTCDTKNVVGFENIF